MLKLEDLYDVEVVVAKDGKEAYDIVKDSMDKGQYFNLIFMDIQVSFSDSRLTAFDSNVSRCPILMASKVRD